MGCKLRISQRSAADELLTMYRDNELKKILEMLLIDGILKETVPDEELSLNIMLMEEEVVAAKENLSRKKCLSCFF